jgi:CRISPR-associated protein Cas2
MKRAWHLVAYDIRDEVRLRRVAKLVEGYGDRVQFSVFRCRMTPETRAELLWRLSQITEEEDSLMVVPLCDSCIGDVIQRGTTRPWPVQPPEYAIY